MAGTTQKPISACTLAFYLIPIGFGQSMSAEAVEFAVMARLGGVIMSDTSQRLEGIEFSFDRISHQAFAIGGEVRLPVWGLAVGGEYLNYRVRFESPLEQDGEAGARAAFITARKYFRRFKHFRPFVGLGVGQGQTTHYREDADKWGGCDTCIGNFGIAQLGGGFEWGGRWLNWFTDAKFLYGLDGTNDDTKGHYDSGFNAQGVGLFTGLSVRF